MRLQRRIFVTDLAKHTLTQNSLQIWKGISINQLRQLIAFTLGDAIIKKLTHDSKRFGSIESFRLWINNKTIYTLVDEYHSLQGIIWFSKIGYVKCDYTFAIRIYPPTRGKHIAQEFMRKVFDNFKPESVWLKTKTENKIAIDLYKKFGFKKHSIEEKNLIMTYVQSF